MAKVESSGGRRLIAGAIGLALLLGIGIGLHLRGPAPAPIGEPSAPAPASPAPASPAPAPPAAPAEGEPAAPVGERADAEGWVDQEATIYHGIPTRIRFRMPRDRAAEGADLAREAWARFEDIGKRFNAFDMDSEVGTFNASAQDVRAVSGEFSALLDVSREVWGLTRGAFDPTVWPVKALWRQAERTNQVPNDTLIEAARARVGLDKLTAVRRSALMGKAPATQASTPAQSGGPSLVHRGAAGIALDFGGIVKGYAVDRVVALLAERGATDWLVQCGGEIAAHGRSPSGEAWRVGIRHPLQKDAVWGSVSTPGDLFVSTSGNYEQPVRIGSREFHHIVDPRTGRPVESPVLGVTVVVLGGQNPNARADAFATALTVMPLDAAQELVQARSDLAALFIVRGPDGRPTEVVTPRMRDLVRSER